ncbi:MAG: hydantoinase B/oxoprolinase family protein [Pseudomonadales bacterium]
MMARTSSADPITLGMLWNRLLAIVEEQAQVLMRTAFSPVVREAGDLSAGVFDASGRMLAQAVTGTPGHVNSMAESVGHFLAAHPVATLRPGDVLLTNDPWLGTGHLNDFTVVTPVFLEGSCIALFAATSHIADVGGRGFGADAGEVYEEGLCIPVTHLFRAGVRDETLMRILHANVRDPVVAQGDLYSLTACNDAGATALLTMLAEYPDVSLADLSDHIVDTSRQAMLAEIAGLPHGVWEQDMWIDGYDKPLRLACRLTLDGQQIALDFSGSAAASAFGINVPMAYTAAYAAFGVRCVVGNDIPNNAGSLSTISVTAPAGSLLNASRPRAVSARHAVGQMLPDVVLGCLAQVIPERVPAEGASCIWNPVFLGEGLSSAHPDVGRFVINPIFNGGTGARPGLPGLSATAFPSGVRSTSTEVNETTSPLVIWRKEYREGSGGAGRYPGGDGQVIEIGHIAGRPFDVSKMFDRIRHPARGRDGGEDGAAGRVYLKSGSELRGKGRETVPAGETLVLETPGGGGLGQASSEGAH